MANKKKGCAIGCGTGFLGGGLMAAFLSWIVNHSVGWALVHMLCGGFYVLYWLFAHLTRVLHELGILIDNGGGLAEFVATFLLP